VCRRLVTAHWYTSLRAHGRQTHSPWFHISRGADTVVFYFDGETVVRASHPNGDALRNP
jgi:hypothetical protein